MIYTYILFVLIVGLIVFYIIKNSSESFVNPNTEDDLKGKNGFNILYTDKGEQLNIALIPQPFGGAEQYKNLLINIPYYKYLAISSYMEFPHVPSNPLDNYIDAKLKEDNDNKSKFYLDMYLKVCDGFLHCFRDPQKYLGESYNKPLALISDSDFCNYNVAKPDPSVEKIYDYVYSCPKVNEDSTCDDWVAYNKNWELGKKVVFKLSQELGLKGLLVGRKGCEVPENCTAVGWVNYGDMLKMYNSAKIVLLPNVADASPRVLTECLSTDLRCLVNKNILGGWKYVNEQTGEFFTDENDVVAAAKKVLDNYDSYSPRQFMIDNYGPINSGKRLKEYLYTNFKDHLNVPEEDVEYVTLRAPLYNFEDLGKDSSQVSK